jgi:hypothetical protein
VIVVKRSRVAVSMTIEVCISKPPVSNYLLLLSSSSTIVLYGTNIVSGLHELCGMIL